MPSVPVAVIAFDGLTDFLTVMGEGRTYGVVQSAGFGVKNQSVGYKSGLRSLGLVSSISLSLSYNSAGRHGNNGAYLL